LDSSLFLHLDSTNQHYQIYLVTHYLPYIRLPELTLLHIHLENCNCNVCQKMVNTFNTAHA
jgi:hypothetical protein